MLTKQTSSTLSDLLNSLKSERTDILTQLGLSENDFTKVPHDVLLENPNDIGKGVNNVKLLNRANLLNIFDTALIKYYDTKEIEYIFYTITKDYLKIEKISQTTYKILGSSYTDEEQAYSFSTKEKIKKLATKKQNESHKPIIDIWLLERTTVVLQYLSDPLHQFALRITQKSLDKIDYSVRQETILSLLRLDINRILHTERARAETSLDKDNNNKIKYIDYRYNLDVKELGIFDTLTIRLFSPRKIFDFNTQTHVTLSTSSPQNLQKVVLLCNRIVEIYGTDISGKRDLDVYDITAIERNSFWTGRTWHLTNRHCLLNLQDKKDFSHYSISITNGLDESGLALTILSFNNLIGYVLKKSDILDKA